MMLGYGKDMDTDTYKDAYKDADEDMPNSEE
jgi:hypothetical protein